MLRPQYRPIRCPRPNDRGELARTGHGATRCRLGILRGVNDERDSAPFPPGQSPFRVKGTLWMGVRAYVEQHVVGGSGRLDEALARDHAEFFAQLFVAAGWYDLFPMLAVSPAIARLRGVAPLDQVRHTAAWHGEHDLKRVYKTMLQQSSPQAICRRFASIYSQLYNFGRVEVGREEAKRVESVVHGMPEPLTEWWTTATEAYLVPILTSAGARNPRMVFRSPVADGESHGVRLVRVASQTIWS